MKKLVMSLLLIIIFNFTVHAEAPELNSKAAILMDSKTGIVLFEKNSYETLPPASITKIMTAIIALDKGDLTKSITVTDTALDGLDPQGSNMGLKVGETLTLSQLIDGLMVASANDAANVIAEDIGGNIENFVGMMNEKSVELGAKNTHYTNPSGLHDDNHYTTAYDIAIICRFAMTIPRLKEIAEYAHIKIAPTNMTPERYYINTNSLISRQRETQYYYEYAKGIKTGHTSKAGYCLASHAIKGDKDIICVTLGAELKDKITHSFVDSKNLFEYGFENFSPYTLTHPGEIVSETKVREGLDADFVSLQSEKELIILLPKDIKPEDIRKEDTLTEVPFAPIAKGQKLSSIKYYYKDQFLGEIDLLANREIKKNPIGFILTFFENMWQITWFRWVIYILGAFLLFYIIIVVIAIRRGLKKKSKRRRYKIR